LYALEICLKARICKKLDQPKLPTAFEIHDIDGLLLLAGLARRQGLADESRQEELGWDS